MDLNDTLVMSLLAATISNNIPTSESLIVNDTSWLNGTYVRSLIQTIPLYRSKARKWTNDVTQRHQMPTFNTTTGIMMWGQWPKCPHARKKNSLVTWNLLNSVYVHLWTSKTVRKRSKTLENVLTTLELSTFPPLTKAIRKKRKRFSCHTCCRHVRLRQNKLFVTFRARMFMSMSMSTRTFSAYVTCSASDFKIKWNSFGYFDPEKILYIMEIINLRGDLTDISA